MGRDIIIIAFALFAMFFGAGNLIFPAFLGLECGNTWITGFLGFIVADVGLAILGLVSAAKSGGEISTVMNKAGDKLGILLGSLIMICLGPLLAIPRTAATTYEMGIQPLFQGFNQIIFSVIFFIIVLLLTIKPSKIIDVIGQVLTPVLLITLAVLIVMGILRPIGSTAFQSRIADAFSEGVKQGYQTMDALAAVALSSVIMLSLETKGYKGRGDKTKMAFYASLISAVGLIIVYGGLTYLGATSSGLYISESLENISQTHLIVDVTTRILGGVGKIILGITIALACLTTAVGLTSATGEYFQKITGGKIKYEVVVIVVCIFSTFISNFGVSTIIKFSAPVLSIIYPATVTLIVLNIILGDGGRKNVYRFATYMALFISIITLINDTWHRFPIINDLPFSQMGFNWVLPVILAAIIGYFATGSRNV